MYFILKIIVSFTVFEIEEGSYVLAWEWNETLEAALWISGWSDFLDCLLVFFLTGLANGLAQTNRSAVDSWKSDYVILNEQANKNLRMSRFSVDLKNDVNADKMAELTQASTTIKDKEKNKIKCQFYSRLSRMKFLRPKLSEGKLFSKTGEVVADSSLKNHIN